MRSVTDLWSIVFVWLLALIISTAALIWFGFGRRASFVFAIAITWMGINTYLGREYSYPANQGSAQAALSILNVFSLIIVLFAIISIVMELATGNSNYGDMVFG